MRRDLRQYVAVGSVNLGHRRGAILIEPYIGIIEISSFRLRRKIDNADTHSRTWPGNHVVAIPIAIAHLPAPGHLVQARTQGVCRRVITDKGISSSHDCESQRRNPPE